MQKNLKIMKYFRAHHTRYEDPPEIQTCSAECKKNHLCFLYSGDSSNPNPCKRIQDAVTDN